MSTAAASPPRFYIAHALRPHAGSEFALPAGATRHVQVRRLQPGQAITLFDGLGGEWQACITHMGRSQVQVELGTHRAIEREAERPVHLAVGLMASDRMDWLVEKATELGAVSLTPLLTTRSSLRLSGERAEKKRAHWQAVAAAACEQCGRNRLLQVQAVSPLADWLGQQVEAERWLLSLDAGATPLRQRTSGTPTAVHLLSGPEGGLAPEEEQAARAAGLSPVSLGARVLRAETAPLAALALLSCT